MEPIGINIFHIIIGIALIIYARRSGSSVKVKSDYVISFAVVFILAHTFIAFRKSQSDKKKVTFEETSANSRRGVRSRYSYKN